MGARGISGVYRKCMCVHGACACVCVYSARVCVYVCVYVLLTNGSVVRGFHLKSSTLSHLLPAEALLLGF